MADFGWAYVKGNLLSGSAPPSGAVQFNDGNDKLAASGDFIFISGSTSQLNLTGTLNVSGAINANEYNVTVTNQNVINLSSTGSTKFGDTTDDLHRFTGSVDISGNISASAFYGDGSNLSNVTTNPAGANTQIQFNNSNNFGASSNLVFDNGKLGVGTSNPDAQPDEKDDLVIGDHTGNRGMTIASTNTGIGTIRFAPNTSANDIEGWIDYSGNTKKMRFGTNGLNTRVTIDGTGKVGIAEGNPDHMLTVAGDISASVNVSASAFYGNGSNLTNLAGGSNNQIQFNNSGELSGSSGLTYNGAKLDVTGEVSASLAVSASSFHGDGSNLSGIATTLDQVTNNGNTTSNAMTASALNLTGLAAGTATNTKFLALDSNNNVVLTSSSGGSGGNIGAAEDGSYTDGLFSDFVASTPIGTAIDKFNEILKIIVPGPAPAVDRINYTNANGIAPKLTFTTQGEAPSGYTDVTSTGSFTSPPRS